MKTKREQALEFVLKEVAAGTEFPDAEAMAFARYGVTTDQIREDYDEHCGKTNSALNQAFFRMEAEGGSFASTLAKAWFLADSGNKAIIEKGWPHLIKRYGA